MLESRAYGKTVIVYSRASSFVAFDRVPRAPPGHLSHCYSYCSSFSQVSVPLVDFASFSCFVYAVRPTWIIPPQCIRPQTWRCVPPEWPTLA